MQQLKILGWGKKGIGALEPRKQTDSYRSTGVGMPRGCTKEKLESRVFLD